MKKIMFSVAIMALGFTGVNAKSIVEVNDTVVCDSSKALAILAINDTVVTESEQKTEQKVEPVSEFALNDTVVNDTTKSEKTPCCSKAGEKAILALMDKMN